MRSIGSVGFTSLIAGAALLLAGGTAAADERAPELPDEASERALPELPEAAGERGAPEDVGDGVGEDADRADPIAETLPSVASEVAVENAFGQRGEIERAARALARAAAGEAAAEAAREAAEALAAEGRAIGEQARALGADNAERGLDRAGAARGEDRRPDGVPGRP